MKSRASSNSLVGRILFMSVVCLAPVNFGCQAKQSTESGTATVEAQEVGTELVAGPWHVWRGPNRNGVVIDQKPPTTWNDSENVIWKVPVPGRGHASPTIVGDQILLATSDTSAETQSVVSFDKNTGEQNWMTVVNTGNFNRKIYPTNTHASSTVTSDGEKLFAVFNNNEVAQLAALDLDGNLLWQKEAAEFKPKKYQFGFGASPILFGNSVIVVSECEGDGSMAAFNKDNGELAWRASRSRATSYSTPVIANVAGKTQLIMSGANSVDSYDPTTGELNWQVKGPWVVTCGTAVWSDDTVFVSGGFPTQRTMAIKADGSGQVVWENKVKFYEQSMLYYDGYLYGLADTGVCYCWDASDGSEMWKGRMSQGVSASPVFAGGHIYQSVEDGRTFVYKASPAGLDVVAENKLGDMAYATPTFVDNRIYMRVADGPQNAKQEWLYCIGSE